MDLEFLSSRYSLYHLEHFFCYLMEDVSLPPDLRHKVRLCFQEAVTNAVVHGNQYDENKYVHISLAQDTDKLILKIRDEGNGFDIGQTRNPLEQTNLNLPGGRGIFLIKEYANFLDYTEGNTLVMEFEM
ncbi:MAG: ATP-binding protein [Chitinophagales bacterium]